MYDCIDAHTAAQALGRAFLLSFLSAGLLLVPPVSAAAAQVTSEGASPRAAGIGPRVFLDCQGPLPCDRNHFRTEIRFANWAQDREDADVHVIATSQMVGGGGRQITLDFIGREDMADITDRLTYISSGTDVQAETLDGLTQTLRLGLLRYAVQSGLGRDFDIQFTGDAANSEPADPTSGLVAVPPKIHGTSGPSRSAFRAI